MKLNDTQANFTGTGFFSRWRIVSVIDSIGLQPRHTQL